jgi:hypothetical protein
MVTMLEETFWAKLAEHLLDLPIRPDKHQMFMNSCNVAFIIVNSEPVIIYMRNSSMLQAMATHPQTQD